MCLVVPLERDAGDYAMLAEGSKARRFGFHEYVYTEDMFLEILIQFRGRKIVP